MTVGHVNVKSTIAIIQKEISKDNSIWDMALLYSISKRLQTKQWCSSSSSSSKRFE
jgi:hypothetical protein